MRSEELGAGNPHAQFVVAERGDLEPEETVIKRPNAGPTKKCSKAPRFDPTNSGMMSRLGTAQTTGSGHQFDGILEVGLADGPIVGEDDPTFLI